jgi:hypothetical protein
MWLTRSRVPSSLEFVAAHDDGQPVEFGAQQAIFDELFDHGGLLPLPLVAARGRKAGEDRLELPADDRITTDANEHVVGALRKGRRAGADCGQQNGGQRDPGPSARHHVREPRIGFLCRRHVASSPFGARRRPCDSPLIVRDREVFPERTVQPVFRPLTRRSCTADAGSSPGLAERRPSIHNQDQSVAHTWRPRRGMARHRDALHVQDRHQPVRRRARTRHPHRHAA